MGIQEAKAVFDEPGHYMITYKPDGREIKFLANIRRLSDNSTSSKLYVEPVQKKVYNMETKRIESINRYNWVGMFDVKKITSAFRTSITITDQQLKDQG